MDISLFLSHWGSLQHLTYMSVFLHWRLSLSLAHVTLLSRGLSYPFVTPQCLLRILPSHGQTLTTTILQVLSLNNLG